MARVRVYDKTKWHVKGAQVGFLLGWAAKRGLVSDDIAPTDVKAAKAGSLSGTELLEKYGGAFTSDMLSAEGQRFAAQFYAKGGPPMPATARAMDAQFAAWRGAKAAPAPKVGSPLEARLARLRARAKQKHQVEVEHLIAFAQLGDRDAAPVLRELATAHKWPRGGRGNVPLGSWADAVAVFLESGAAAVARQVKAKKLDADVAIGLLEEVPSAATALAILEIAKGADRGRNVPLLGASLGALGIVLSDPAFVLDDAAVRAARALTHRTLQRKLKPVDIVHCFGVLAAVGDRSSLELVASRPPLGGDWRGTEKPVISRLKKRLGAAARR